MLRIAASLLGLISVPMLVFLAWRRWAQTVRAELPPWRNGLCVAAMLLTFLNWAGVVALEVPVFLNPEVSRPVGLTAAMLTLSRPLCVITMLLALALRRLPRPQLLLAASLTLVSWPLGYAGFSFRRTGRCLLATGH
jgi:hypothetical protein